MKLKKSVKIILIIVIVGLIATIGVLVASNFTNKPKVKEVKIVNEIKEYGYSLKDNKSKNYSKLFQELKKVLSQEEIDEEEYASIISKMFIMDLYSLNEKSAKTDIGGVDFVHSSEQADFLEKVADTLYRYVESNIYGERKQELPTVKEVTVESVEKTSFDYLDTTDDNAYKVKVSWTYDKDLGYESESTLIVVHEENKLVIAEMN